MSPLLNFVIFNIFKIYLGFFSCLLWPLQCLFQLRNVQSFGSVDWSQGSFQKQFSPQAWTFLK